MDKEILMFGDINLVKNNFYRLKRSIFQRMLIFRKY